MKIWIIGKVTVDFTNHCGNLKIIGIILAEEKTLSICLKKGYFKIPVANLEELLITPKDMEWVKER